MNTRSKVIAWIAGIAAVVSWGLSFLSIKVTLTVFPPMTQALVRHIIAAGALFVMMKFIEPNARLDRKDIPKLFVGGILGITLYFFLENNGVQRISVSSASLIIATIPIMTIVADAIVFREKLTGRKLMSVIMSFMGVFVIVGNPNTGNNEFIGYLLMLGAAASWVIYTVVTKTLFDKYSDLSIVYYQTLTGIITLFPFTLVERFDIASVTPVITINMLFLSVICSALATYFYMISMSTLGIGISSLMMNLVPIVAIIAGAVVFGERISAMQIIGGILVIAAVCLSSTTKSDDSSVDLQMEK